MRPFVTARRSSVPLLLIDSSSHFAHWQQVEAVNSAILEFLAAE